MNNISYARCDFVRTDVCLYVCMGCVPETRLWRPLWRAIKNVCMYMLREERNEEDEEWTLLDCLDAYMRYVYTCRSKPFFNPIIGWRENVYNDTTTTPIQCLPEERRH